MQESKNYLLARVHRVIEAKSDNFVDLIKIAQLDPKRDLRFSNWSGSDFKGLDLRGFDFTGSRLVDCDFANARIEGTRFEAADIKGANLRKAKDWAAYVKGWAPAEQPVGTRHLRAGAVFQDAPFAPEMVVIPPGSFTMGSPEGEARRLDDEGPQHTVTIEKPFAVGRFAVTFEEWDACVADGGGGGYEPSDHGFGHGRRPVIYVSWNDATAYAAWLSRKTGKPYRLLSEAEREYVARAGTTTPFWWGASISPQQANYDGNLIYDNGPKGERRDHTLPVDSLDPNPWGLYQVHGNVWEWTQDCWHDNYAGAPSDGSAWTIGDCSRRVVRGGSWVSGPWYLRAAGRLGSSPVDRDLDSGFRLGRTLTP